MKIKKAEIIKKNKAKNGQDYKYAQINWNLERIKCLEIYVSLFSTKLLIYCTMPLMFPIFF